MDIVETLRAAAANTQRIVEGVRPDQLALPTPCAELDVRGVLNHLIGGAAMMAAFLRGEQPSGAPEWTDEPAGAAKQAVEQLLTALEIPGVMEQEFNIGMGPMPGARLAGIALMETVVHGWDLAKATGQEHGIPAPLAEGVLEQVRHIPDALRGEGKSFAMPVPIADDAPAADRLAAFLGRQV